MKSSRPEKIYSGVKKLATACWSHSLQNREVSQMAILHHFCFNEVQTMSGNVINQDSPLIVPILHPAVTQIET